MKGSDLTAFGAPDFDADFDTICVIYFLHPLPVYEGAWLIRQGRKRTEQKTI